MAGPASVDSWAVIVDTTDSELHAKLAGKMSLYGWVWLWF